MSDTTNNEKAQAPLPNEAEAVNAASAAKLDAAKKGSSGMLGKTFGFLLLVVVIVGIGLASKGQLQPLYESLMQAEQKIVVVEQSVAPAITEKVEPEPEAMIDTPAELLPVPESLSATEAEPDQENQLLQTIDSLRGELQRMEVAQRALNQSLLEQQKINLQVRLRWITDPSSRLPQIQLAWEEISLLAGLADVERQQAESMFALARSNVVLLQQWQGALQKWADSLQVPVHQDVMPEPEHPWLAWLVGQFHLRQAPSMESQRLMVLRDRLFETSRMLTQESWPTEAEWQQLHAQLLLQVKAMQQDDVSVELGLPDNFAAIQADIITLRQSAQQWPPATSTGEF